MNLTRKLLAEFYASAFYSFVVFGTENNAVLVGFVFWSGVQGTGFISPFHFNSLAQISSFFHKRITHYLALKDKNYLIRSIPVQILGNFIGALFAWWIYDNNFYFKPNTEYNVGQYFFAEAIFTSQIVLIALALGQWSESKLIGLFALSGGLTTGILTVGYISGACFNPTVCFTINFVQAIRSKSQEPLKYLWLYIAAPVIGSLFGTILGIIIHPKPEEKKHHKNAPTGESARLESPKT
jgi:glycerol uptake facilitator-like aquaporin